MSQVGVAVETAADGPSVALEMFGKKHRRRPTIATKVCSTRYKTLPISSLITSLVLTSLVVC
jgi:hypothetical protein